MTDETEHDEWVDIVFDGPPSHIAGRFVEVENEKGASIHFGEWVERPDGFWALRIHTKPQAPIFADIAAECERQDAESEPLDVVRNRRTLRIVIARMVRTLESLDRKATP